MAPLCIVPLVSRSTRLIVCESGGLINQPLMKPNVRLKSPEDALLVACEVVQLGGYGDFLDYQILTKVFAEICEPRRLNFQRLSAFFNLQGLPAQRLSCSVKMMQIHTLSIEQH
jgi:hypothetical protein